jgi:acyl-coenzyme A synthetase/AMP-(fatty) acid ligase
VDESLTDVAPGQEGELLIAGPQVTPGYWQNREATSRAYVVRAGDTRSYYRTGDRVRRPLGDGPLTFVGRLDDQVKVLGHRVELGEVEARLREEPGVAAAAAVAWPRTASGAAGIVAFVSGTALDADIIRTNVQKRLPSYAGPRTVHVVPELPRNANGKIDRRALMTVLSNAPIHG